jgi:hypothetical protein
LRLQVTQVSESVAATLRERAPAHGQPFITALSIWQMDDVRARRHHWYKWPRAAIFDVIFSIGHFEIPIELRTATTIAPGDIAIGSNLLTSKRKRDASVSQRRVERLQCSRLQTG